MVTKTILPEAPSLGYAPARARQRELATPSVPAETVYPEPGREDGATDFLEQERELDEIIGRIRAAVLRDGTTVEEILAGLPAAGDAAFRARYGDELADEFQSLLKKDGGDG